MTAVGSLVWRVPAAVVAGLVILAAVLWFLRAFSSGGRTTGAAPEDVASENVFFVCGECGTEYQVTKVGEVSVPRHCGEPMRIERRPKSV